MLDKIIQGLIIGAILIILIGSIAIIFSIPTLFLWNWLMPTIFGLAKITFWQALGLNILAEILFKTHTIPND